MLGWIEYDERCAKPSLTQRQIMGGTFLALRLGKPSGGVFARHHAARWARRMVEQGVRSAVFSADFPYTSLFIRQGIRFVDPLPLRRALCASCVHRRLEELGICAARAVVAIAAQYMSREVEETIRAIAVNYRYILLSVGSGGEAFARDMLRRYGTALLLSPTREQLERADALILFAPRPDLRQENRVLCVLHHGGKSGRGYMDLRLADRPGMQMDPDWPQEQLAAALYGMGVLKPEMVTCEIIC